MKQRGWECDWQFDWIGKHLNSTSGAAQTGTTGAGGGGGGGGGANTTAAAVSSQPRTNALNDTNAHHNVTSGIGAQPQSHLGNNLAKNFANNRDKVFYLSLSLFLSHNYRAFFSLKRDHQSNRNIFQFLKQDKAEK